MSVAVAVALAAISSSMNAQPPVDVIIEELGLTGHLFLHGAELSPPYAFSGVGQDTLYLNGEPLAPLRPRGPAPPPPEPGWSIDVRMQTLNPLAQAAGLNAVSERAGIRAARAVFLEQSDVESAEFEGSTGLKIKFRPHPEPILWSLRYLPGYAGKMGTALADAQRSMIKSIQESLQNEGLVAFGMKYRLILSARAAADALAEVEKIHQGKPALSEDRHVQKFLEEVAASGGFSTPAVGHSRKGVERSNEALALVVGYGTVLSPPYEFSGAGEDTLRLNGIAYSPSAADPPGPELVSPEVAASSIQPEIEVGPREGSPNVFHDALIEQFHVITHMGGYLLFGSGYLSLGIDSADAVAMRLALRALSRGDSSATLLEGTPLADSSARSDILRALRAGRLGSP